MPPSLDLEQEIRQLGLPIEEYRSNPNHLRQRQKVGAVFLLSGSAFIFFALMLEESVLPELHIAIFFCTLFVGGVLLSLGCWLIATSTRRKGHRFLVFEHGFIFEQLQRVEKVRWDAISTVKMKSWTGLQGRMYLCQLGLQNGNSFRFIKNASDFPGIAHFCDRIQLELTSRQLPQALETFEQGETLQFGLIRVDSTGITNGDRFLPWKLIQAMQLENGAIVITSETGPIRWTDSTPYTVPNIFVLLSLVEQVVPRRHRVSPS